MTMNKKERQEMEAAIYRCELLAALRWTSEVKPDVPPPVGGPFEYTEGWRYNAYSAKVYRAWSGCVRHGEGDAPTENDKYKSASQNGISLYSTREKALAAMRYEVEVQSAKKLLEIDTLIKAKEADK